MRLALAVAALVAGAAPLRAAAQLVLGARLGYARALGDVGGSPALAMGDWLQSQVPVQLEVLWTVRPRIAVGPYASWGLAQPGGDAADECDRPAGDCDGSILRVGLQATWTAPPARGVAPWLGVGLGYEWSRLDRGAERTRFHGVELLNLQAGGDVAIGERLGLGPFVRASLGRYERGRVGDFEGELPRRRVHAWLELGVRGRFDAWRPRRREAGPRR